MSVQRSLPNAHTDCRIKTDNAIENIQLREANTSNTAVNINCIRNMENTFDYKSKKKKHIKGL